MGGRFFAVPPIVPRDPQIDGEVARKAYVDAHGIMDGDDYDPSAAPTDGQAMLWVPSSGAAGRWAPRTITPSGIGAEAVANKGAAGGYAPLNSGGVVPLTNLAGAAYNNYGILRLGPGGDLSGTAAAPTVPALLSKAQWTGLLGVTSFGDVIESFPRLLASGALAIPTGVISATGLQPPYAGSISQIRFGTASSTISGSGSLVTGIYTGTSVTALTRQATASVAAPAMNTYYPLALSNSVSWNAGDFVYFLALWLGYTTPPVLRTVVSNGPGSAAMNPTTRLVASSGTGQTALPATVNINSGYSGSGTPQWWAAA